VVAIDESDDLKGQRKMNFGLTPLGHNAQLRPFFLSAPHPLRIACDLFQHRLPRLLLRLDKRQEFGRRHWSASRSLPRERSGSKSVWQQRNDEHERNPIAE
jgi:hypothetical protein